MCPDPELCKRIGRHIHGAVYEKYIKDEVFRKVIDDNKVQAPSLIKKIQNFTSAFVDYAKSGFLNTPEYEQKLRMDTCRQCKFFEPINELCLGCGCFLQSKINWSTSKCPEGKWPNSEKLKEIEELHLQF